MPPIVLEYRESFIVSKPRENGKKEVILSEGKFGLNQSVTMWIEVDTCSTVKADT